jgi:hypothetical protein
MRRRFRNWIVHFGSCATAGADQGDLASFVENTGISLVTGYKENVDWVESAAMDMILLTELQKYVDLRAMKKKITRDYQPMVERLGFESYP